VAETLVSFDTPIRGRDGTMYEARACGGPMDDYGRWQGWIEFVPIDGGRPVRSPRETTQPNRIDTEYWATGLTPVYLEGALKRALDGPITVPTLPRQPSIFDGPAPHTTVAVQGPASSVLDPFSVYEKGEPLLRQQLSALAAWHLVNIALEYRLTDEPAEELNRLPAPALRELIVRGVRARLAAPSGTKRSSR